MSNLVADRFAAGLRLARELLASWRAPGGPNSITLSSSLAGRRLARELARELDSVMDLGLKVSIPVRSPYMLAPTLWAYTFDGSNSTFDVTKMSVRYFTFTSEQYFVSCIQNNRFALLFSKIFDRAASRGF